MRLTLQPFGPLDPRILDHLRGELRDFDEVAVAKETPLPPGALDTKRGQYRASVFEYACETVPGDRVLGVTAADLFEPPLNFVFGHARIHGREAVISVARLGDANMEKVLERTTKEAVHEIGHTLGLMHDEDHPRCVMHFSHNLGDTDRKGRNFCPDCLQAAEFTLKRLRK